MVSKIIPGNVFEMPLLRKVVKAEVMNTLWRQNVSLVMCCMDPENILMNTRLTEFSDGL